MKKELNFRQIHLDFHTSPLIPDIAADFDPERFAETLKKAHINSITCFARCHHGMLYYDSKLNPERIHPELKNRDLLKQQIEACHKLGIKVPIYTTVQWDAYTAEQHADWLAVSPKGMLGATWQSPLGAGFYRNLCINSPYRDFLKAHLDEIITMFKPVDGIFLDIVNPVECICSHCRAKMEQQGYQMHLEEDRKNFIRQSINEFENDISNFIRERDSECLIFYNRGHIGPEHRKTVDSFSHFELESLPSGLWGYLHFPTTMRYARNLGLDCLAQTGKFHTMWGDFHSLKNEAALEFEVFHMLALNSKCSIGDQLDPKGQLSQSTYDLIGRVYEQVEKKEPWCRGAKAITEIGLFTPEELDTVADATMSPEIQGAVRMLQEGAYQFEIIDSHSDFSRFSLLILPDKIKTNGALSTKLTNYVQNGGKLLASFDSGFDDNDEPLDCLGIQLKRDDVKTDIYGQSVAGKITDYNDYADYIYCVEDCLEKGLSHTQYVMYIKGREVVAIKESDVMAIANQSYFDRDYRHYCSHRQTPSSGVKGYDAVVRHENTVYFTHPIFKQYWHRAPKWCKTMVCNAIDLLLGEPILKHNGPSGLITSVNRQNERYVAHVLYYIPERRSRTIDIIEDVVPLYDLKVSVRLPREADSVKLVPQMTEIPFDYSEGRLRFTIPQVNGHQMIEIK